MLLRVGLLGPAIRFVDIGSDFYVGGVDGAGYCGHLEGGGGSKGDQDTIGIVRGWLLDKNVMAGP